MIYEYTHENINKVLQLFKDSKLAHLKIQEVKKESKNIFFIDYSLIDSYTEEKQVRMNKVLQEAVFEKIRVIDLIDSFIENKAVDNVNHFSLYFNVLDTDNCVISYKASFGSNVSSKPSINDLQKCINDLDTIVLSLGAKDVQIPNVYLKEGPGRTKKGSLLTVGKLSSILKQVLFEERK